MQRRNLKRKFLDLENTVRHSLKSFGVRLNKVGRGGFDAAVRTASADELTRSPPPHTQMVSAARHDRLSTAGRRRMVRLQVGAFRS